MEEISDHNKNADEKLGPGRVLIAAEDDRTCAQIKEVPYIVTRYSVKKAADFILI